MLRCILLYINPTLNVTVLTELYTEHCFTNTQNFRSKTESVPVETDAIVLVYILYRMYVHNSQTHTV